MGEYSKQLKNKGTPTFAFENEQNGIYLLSTAVRSEERRVGKEC